MKKGRYSLAGGLPVKQNDLALIQDEGAEALRAFLIGLKPNYVLNGIQISELPNGSEVLTSGFAFINGEVLRFDSVPIIRTINSYWLVKSAAVLSNARIYRNGQNQEVFSEAKAVLVTANQANSIAMGSAGFDTVNTTFAKAIDIEEVKRRLALPVNGPWRAVGSAGNPVFETDWQNLANISLNETLVTPSPVSFRKDTTGIVHLRGAAEYTGSSQSGTVYTLPSGFRPTADLLYYGIGESGGGSALFDTRLIIVKSNGDVMTNFFSKSVFFEGISFFAV